MKLDYRWGANEQYCEETDEMIGDTICYTYEPDLDELYEAVNKIVAKYYGIPVKVAKKIVEDFDIDLDICEEMFEEEIKEHFEADAYNEYNDR